MDKNNAHEMDCADLSTHNRTVEKICSRVQFFYTSKKPFRIYHGSTNSTRHANFDRDAIVDVSALNHVLHIDTESRTAMVEPNVPMDILVRETAKSDLLPPVVMEFPGITVGGGFVGTAGESSSFKHGFFDRTVLSAEVVLADGTIVIASSSKNRELFEGLRGSFGTLGVLTMVELRLIPLKTRVEISYHPTSCIDQAMTIVKAQSANPRNDYIDGILFSKTSGVIITGRLVDANSSKLPFCTFLKPWDEWFWIHARKLANKGIVSQELVPIEDYLLRYDRGAFWMGMYAYQQFLMPFIWLTRFLLDYFMHTRIMYHALHSSGFTDRFIIQDIAFPVDNTTQFVQYVDREFGIYPLWLCPLRKDCRSSMGHPKLFGGLVGGEHVECYDGLYINVGVWGPYASSEDDYVRANKKIEKKAQQLGGLKWLYSHVFYTEDEWWSIYDRQRYDALRSKFSATSLPSIWDKVKHRGGAPVDGKGLKGLLRRLIRSSPLLSSLYGIYKAIRGGDYMIRKKSL